MGAYTWGLLESYRKHSSAHAPRQDFLAIVRPFDVPEPEHLAENDLPSEVRDEEHRACVIEARVQDDDEQQRVACVPHVHRRAAVLARTARQRDEREVRRDEQHGGEGDRQQQKKEVAPVVSKALGVALTGDPIAVLKVAKAADEALLSTDTAKLVAALKSVDVALSDALKSNGVIPPLADVEDVAKKAAAALATTDKAKIKETFSALTQAANSADKLQVVGVLADGSKLASKINPADAAAATGAVLDLLKESGAQ